jgi:hypothetical protein
MSKKYVPSFLRDGGALKDGALRDGALRDGALRDDALKDGTLKDGVIKEVVDPPSRNFSQQERSNSSSFNKVSHDHRKEKPDTVPKLAPATLASVTSLSPLSAESTNKGGGSFASKFAEQVRISEDPNYQKPVDLSSADDFPALGAVKKNNVVIPPFKPQPMERRQPTERRQPLEKRQPTELTELKSGSAPSFAEMASLWAKKKEDEDREKAEFQRRKELEEEKMRQAARLMKKVPVLGSINRRGVGRGDGDEEEEENAYINPDEQSSLGGGSNYEYEEEESFEGEDDEFGEGEGGHEDGEEEEYNPNAGWDGRRKEDLY